MAVKTNRPRLLARIDTHLSDEHEILPRHDHAEKAHGRIVAQITRTMPTKGIVDTDDWPQCMTIGRVDSIRVVKGKPSDLEQRFYISSRELSPKELATAIRAY